MFLRVGTAFQQPNMNPTPFLKATFRVRVGAVGLGWFWFKSTVCLLQQWWFSLWPESGGRTSSCMEHAEDDLPSKVAKTPCFSIRTQVGVFWLSVSKRVRLICRPRRPDTRTSEDLILGSPVYGFQRGFPQDLWVCHGFPTRFHTGFPRFSHKMNVRARKVNRFAFGVQV